MISSRAVAAIALSVSCAASATGSPAATDTGRSSRSDAVALRSERLAALGRLWGAVRVYHPYLAYQDIDWDAALVAAVPKVVAAHSDDEYAAALQSMIEVLHDPATSVERAPAPKPPEGTDASRNSLDWPSPGTLAVHLGGFENYVTRSDFLARVVAGLPKAGAVLIDLRGRGDEDLDASSGEVAAAICRHLVTGALQGPTQRFLLHSGFASQDRQAPSGTYYSAFVTQFASTFPPDKDAMPRRLVVLANAASAVPDVVLALRQAGEAQLVAHGAISDRSLVTRKTVELFGGLRAKVRASELTTPLEGHALAADLTALASAPPKADDPAYQIALELARKPRAAHAGPARATAAARALPEGRFHYDDPYEAMTAPSLEYRLLALFRYWNAIHDFYSYLPLLDEDWDALLPRLVALFESAEGETAYALAVAEMVAHVSDGHSQIRGNPALVDRVFGSGRQPFRVRRIEGAAVVVELTDRAAATEGGIAVGDIVLSIEGESIDARVARLSRYQPASTPAAKVYYLANAALRGPDGSTAALSVRDIHDRVKTLKVKRSKDFRQPISTGDHYRTLEGNIGYADLTQLTGNEVGPMLDKLKDARALVLDMRGYPKDNIAWKLAPRLNAREARFAALFQRAVVTGAEPDELQRLRLQFTQRLPPDPSSKPKYDKPTVMLIDERTQSSAEHSGLFFEAASGTRFIGSQTAGANGDVTTVALPGGLLVYFTGHDVRHADGRQLQRVGLVPEIEAHPTLAGFRAGKDEVLDRALQALREGLPTQPASPVAR